jgi:1,4-alpha-glucan branching enzyme
MIRKSYNKSGRSCLVTFTVPKDVPAENIHLCGEFNDWGRETLPLTRRKDGRFSRSISLRAGRSYRFRYLVNADRWENDQAADDFVPNPYGSADSVVAI